MDDIIIYAFALVSLVAGALIGVFIQRHVTTKRIGEANDLANRIVEEARKEAQAQKKEILLQGQNEIFSQKHTFEMECKEQERALKNREKKLQDISDRMEEKMERITQKEHDILAQEKDQTQRERVLAEKETQVEAKLDEQERRLQEVSGLTAEEAKTRLFEEIEARTRHEAAKMMRVIETEARETADRKAKEILACAIQRYAGDYVGEQTVTAVTLPSEDMKGRIMAVKAVIFVLSKRLRGWISSSTTPRKPSFFPPTAPSVVRWPAWLLSALSRMAVFIPPALRTWCTSASRSWKCRSAKWANRPRSMPAYTA